MRFSRYPPSLRLGAQDEHGSILQQTNGSDREVPFIRKNSEPTIAWLGLPASMPVGPRSEAVRDRREYCARSEPQRRRGLRAAASVVTVIPRRLPGAGLVSHHVGTEGSSSAAFDRLVLHLLRRVDPDGDAPPTRL